MCESHTSLCIVDSEGKTVREVKVSTEPAAIRSALEGYADRLVAESFEEGANISEVARRHGVVRGLLTVWRHKFATAAVPQAPSFVPVRISSESGPATADQSDQLACPHKVLPQMASLAGKHGGAIEIECNRHELPRGSDQRARL